MDVTLNPLSADEMRGETFPVPPAPAQRAARRCARRGASEVPSGPQGSISIKYDHLVVACGCRVSDSVVPGARAIDTLDVLVNEIVGFARASA